MLGRMRTVAPRGLRAKQVSFTPKSLANPQHQVSAHRIQAHGFGASLQSAAPNPFTSPSQWCPVSAARHSHVVRSAPPASPIPTATAGDIYEFICKGPLLANCGVSPESIVAGLDEWLRVGKQLAVQLDMNHDDLNDVERLRIYQYYLPVYFWCREQITSHKASGNKNVMVLGISAPQGCGKSTLVEQLELLFKWAGGQAASVSVDDFYLSFKDQSALAASNPSNPLLELRGNAGTHDLALGTSTLEELRTLTEKGKSAAVPRYDKSANSGRGDRADPSTWPKLDGPLDVIFFEGWMSGFTPISDEEAAALDPSLPPVNACLRSYKEAWDSYVDSWLVVRIGDPQWVFGWRLQAEEKMRASGKPGMTNDQIADFVARFQVAYRAYLPGLYNNGPTTAKAGRLLTIQVDQNRTPVA